MSDIAVRRNHGMTLKKARAAGEQIAAELAEEFDFTYEWSGNTLNFKRMGVTGTIVFDRSTITGRPADYETSTLSAPAATISRSTVHCVDSTIPATGRKPASV